ncbi:hypothetical protein B0H19DRAFT_1208867 [Mycena capillaripes]|nr:hypothetical protein B0H19DRAFT_1208867 [Mycena capillaripes]
MSLEKEMRDLGKATAEHLTELATACQQATFGFNQTDVLDESYHKGGKMELTNFAAHPDIVASGHLDTITPDILDGHNSDKVLRAEMYKLNVYGPDSFFKAHKDTPRADDMIRSLVVVFPTAHKGGALSFLPTLLRNSVTAGPAIANVAFYSDTTHAVEPVLEGHRVTLTYNLFLANRPDAVGREAAGRNRIIRGPVQKLKETLLVLLADPAFLPTGSLIAFGLTHQSL